MVLLVIIKAYTDYYLNTNITRSDQNNITLAEKFAGLRIGGATNKKHIISQKHKHSSYNWQKYVTCYCGFSDATFEHNDFKPLLCFFLWQKHPSSQS